MSLESPEQGISFPAPHSPFITKDSGKREEFSTGAQRDIQDGKPRYDLIPLSPLRRLADVYQRGSRKYSERNWEQGMPFSRVYASLLRHLFSWAEGIEDGEDHLGSCAFNIFALMFYQDQIQKNRLPAQLNDM
jgi:hypothetical protein